MTDDQPTGFKKGSLADRLLADPDAYWRDVMSQAAELPEGPTVRNQTLVHRDAVAWLAVHALNELYIADQEEGCCPKCCGPCRALDLMREDGSLDWLVRKQGDGNDWWDPDRRMVDPKLFGRAWRRTDCHEED